MSSVEILGLGLFIILSFIGIDIFTKRKIKRGLEKSWAQYPNYEFKEPPKEKYLIEAFEIFRQKDPSFQYIDQITWRDLDMQAIFNRINQTKSSLGAQVLYHRLRTIKMDSRDRQYFEELQTHFQEHRQDINRVQYIFANLGFYEDNRLFSFLSSEVEDRSSGFFLHLLMGLVPLGLFVLGISGVHSSAYGLLAISLMVNMFYTTKKKRDLEEEFKRINYLLRALNTGRKLKKISLPKQEAMEGYLAKFSKYRFLSLPGLVNMGNEMEVLSYYVNMIFMIPFIFHGILIRDIKKYKDQMIQVLHYIGEIDAALGVLSYKETIGHYCQPECIEEKAIKGQGIYHPLLEDPVKNLVDWDRNTLVSGSNASGKSTYVKSVAINAIFSQTIYIALADSFALKEGNILTSMAIKDDVLEGDSYFVAEVKSLKRIVDDIQRPGHSYYFVDEILKGTNTIERIGASSAIIDFFIKNACLSMVASHDIELTRMFQDQVANIHFRESFNQEGQICFDYKLYQGPSQTKNAIKLLEVSKFPREIVEVAQERVRSFQEKKTWS